MVPCRVVKRHALQLVYDVWIVKVSIRVHKKIIISIVMNAIIAAVSCWLTGPCET